MAVTPEFLTSLGAVLFGSMATKEAGKATGAELTPQVARMLLSPGFASFPVNAPRPNSTFFSMISQARNRMASNRTLSYSEQIAKLQSTVTSEVLDRIREYGATQGGGLAGATAEQAARAQNNALNNVMYLGREAEGAILSLTAAKKSVLDMINGDRRLSGFVSDPRNEKLIGSIKNRLMGATYADTIGMLTSFGQAAEASVEGFGNIFDYYHRSNTRFLNASRASDKIPAAIGLRLDSGNQVMSAMSRFDKFNKMPSSTRDLALGSLTQAEQAKLGEYQKALQSKLGGRFQFNPGQGDVYEIMSSFGQPEGAAPRSFRYARVRINSGEINLPLGEAGDYFVGEQGKAQGHIYFRGKSGATMYSPVGKVINIDNTGVDISSTPAITGHDNIWNPQTGKYLDVAEALEAGKIRSAEEILFSSAEGSDEAIRYMEEIDPTKNPLVAIARKHSQILMQEERSIVGIEPVERFNAHLKTAQAQGISLFPVAGPKQGDKGIYHWAEAGMNGPEAGVYMGTFTGELENTSGGVRPASVIPLGRRPNRHLNNPLTVVNPGSRTALSRVGNQARVIGNPMGSKAMLLDAYPFRSGAFRGMLQSGLEPFVTGAVFSTPRGQARSPEIFLEGSRGLINPNAEQVEGTFIRPGRRTSIETGTENYPFEYNPKLQPFLEEVDALGDADPMQRQRMILDMQERSGVGFSEGEALGRRRLNNGTIENTFVDAGGTASQGRVLLQDVIPIEGGYKLAFGREVPAGAGKLEGGTKTNQHLFSAIADAESQETISINSKYDAKVKEEQAKAEERHKKRLARYEEESTTGQWTRSIREEELEKLERARKNDLDKTVSQVNLERTNELDAMATNPAREEAIQRNKREILGQVRDDSAMGPLTDEQKNLYSVAAESLTEDVSHISEGKEIYKDGNTLAIRGQQQYATSKFTGSTLDAVLPADDMLVDSDFYKQIASVDSKLPMPAQEKYIKGFKNTLQDFHAAAQALQGARYSEKDTNALLVMLKKVNAHLKINTPNNQRRPYQEAVYGLIFGLEQKGTGFPGLAEMMEGQQVATTNMLKALGFSKEHQASLMSGIESSPAVVGLNVQTSRDFSLDSNNDAKLERRYVEEIYDSTRSTIEAEGSPYRSRHMLVFDQALQGIAPLDSTYVSSVQEMANRVGSQPVGERGKVGSDLVLDLSAKIPDESNAVEMAKRRGTLEQLKQSGGFIKYSENSMEYLPSSNLLDASTVKDSRSARLTEDLKLKNIIARIFDMVEKNIENMDDDVVQALHGAFKEFKTDLNKESIAITTHLLEGGISGAKYETVYGAELNKSLPAYMQPYQMGLSRSRIDESFDLRINKAKQAGREHEVAFLNKRRADVLAGKVDMPMMSGQPPSIGPEFMSIYSGRYNPKMDQAGGVSIPAYGEWISNGQTVSKDTPGAEFVRMGGNVTNKTSADFDHDAALTKMIEVSSADEHLLNTPEGVEEAYGKVFALTGDDSMKEQFGGQRSYNINQAVFDPIIKDSLKDKLGANGSLELGEVQKAFMRWSGQSEIGQTSNAAEEIRFIKRILEETGAITRTEAEDLSVFVNKMEQNAVGFKHLDRTLGSVFSESVGRILSEPNPEKRSSYFQEFFDSFFYTDKGGQKANYLLPERTPEQIEGLTSGLSRAKVTRSTLDASKKAEDIAPATVLRALSSGDHGSFEAAFASAPAAERTALLNSSINALPPEQREREKAGLRDLYEEKANEMSDAQQRLAAGNQAEIDKAQARQGGGGLDTAMGSLADEAEAAPAPMPAPSRVSEEVRNVNAEANFVRSMRSEMSIGAEDAKGLLENKFARTVGIGAAAMAGVYALFTKGYDDEPLSDIPPPPSNYGMNSNAQMQPLTGGGSLVSDSYRRQSMDMADALGADYSESNIPAPTSIMKRSYLDGATARISSRSLNLDRTNPVEYARSLRQAIPGSSIGLNINTTYSVPSDMERKL